jgi:hypothetical protein
MERIPRAPSMTLQFNEVFVAIRRRSFFVRRYLFVFASDAIALYFTPESA